MTSLFSLDRLVDDAERTLDFWKSENPTGHDVSRYPSSFRRIANHPRKLQSFLHLESSHRIYSLSN